MFPTDDVVFTPHPGRLDGMRPTDSSRRVAGYFLASVLLLGVYVTGRKSLANGIPLGHGNSSSAVVFFTVNLRSSSPLVPVLVPSEWARTAVRISFAASLSCVLGKSLHVTAIVAMKLYCSTHQRARLLSITTVFIWLVLKPLFYNKNVKVQFEEFLIGSYALESSEGSWTLFGQMEPLAILYYASMSVVRLLQSSLTKLNGLHIHLNVQLMTFLGNTQVHTKYVLLIKFIMLI